VGRPWKRCNILGGVKREEIMGVGPRAFSLGISPAVALSGPQVRVGRKKSIQKGGPKPGRENK